MSFQIAGDMCDLHSFLLGEMDHSVGTLTPCKVACIPHAALSDIIDKYPRIARALWRDTLIDAAVFREWMVGLGRRSSYGRGARLLCEGYVRCEAVGLAVDHRFPFPITQTELGDATGLSLVHMNRTLQELRRDGLITFRDKTVDITDWEGLQRAGEFDPKYLHLGGDKGGTVGSLRRAGIPPLMRRQHDPPASRHDARYYFSARGPNRHIPDYDDLELSDLMTARAIALRAAADVLAEMGGHEHHPDWRFEITDEDGKTVLTISFSEAAKPGGSGRA